MSNSHTIRDRRHADPVILASNLRPGDRFLDQSTGRYVTFVAADADTFDPSQLVNLEAK